MKIFVTGAAGFVASTLIDRLLARGDKVVGIDNFATGRRDSVQKHENYRFIEGTIAEESLMHDLIGEQKPDLVIHAAAAYKNPDNWEEDARTNVTGTVNVVKAAQAADCNRIIYFQTALCYGLNPKEQPITLDHHIDAANSSYAVSKTAGEQYIQISGMSYVTFRLANAYGPRNISGPLPTFYSRLTANKPCFVMDTRRDFIYIEDLANCVMSAVDGKGNGTYHISSGSDYSIKELFDATIAALDIKLDKEVEVIDRNPDDAFTILLDPSRTKADFGWEVKTSLKDGIQKTIDYYKEFGINETFTHLRQEEK